MSIKLNKRMALEREVVAKLIEVARKHGYEIKKVDDGEDAVKCSSDAEALDTVFSVDESLMFFKHPDQPKPHCAFIVLGNSGHDAIADHSLGEGWDDVMAEVSAFCDVKEEEVWGEKSW